MADASSSHRLVLLLLPILLSFFCRLELSSSQALKTFGESCDSDCDERQLLTCSLNTSICECMRANTMFYDRSRLRCVGLVGESCVRYGNEFYCAPHSHCKAPTNICGCDKGYFQTENGTCVLVAKYGESCSSKRPCDKDSGMQCSLSSTNTGSRRRSCQCIFPKDQYYNATAKMCISYASGNCTGSCVSNAECAVDIYELRKGENIYGKSYNYNVTVGQKCKCKEGFRETRERQCLASYRQPCGGEKEEGGCNPEENLICFDSSICLCKSPLTQIYDWKMLKCRSLAGAKCSGGGDNGDDHDDDGESPCVSNAECANRKCVCKAGFTSTPFSTCLKDLGEECKKVRGSSDDDNGESSCNYWRGLSCHQNSGTCGCIDASLKYDSNAKLCESEEGGRCGTFEFSDSLGFVGGSGNGKSFGRGEAGGEESVGVRMMMANHKRGIMLAGGNSNSNSSSSFTPTSPTSGGGSGIVGGKVFHSFIKIHIKCKSGLECVDAFGERIRSGGGSDAIFQGFCEK
ncbi:unnamed protein product [Orchesella dallaii]|uniref:Uncharacterized protein n=1 Tax=Orchesella dallaii TaxID=48710 RepID=A0ABP1QHK4_9HEXA